MRSGLTNSPLPDDEGAPNSGGIVIYVTEHRVTKAGAAVNLSGVPLDVLLYLAAHQDRFVTKTELEESVWSGRATDDTIYQHIRTIRLATGDPDVLTTGRGKGYRLNSSVTVVSSQSKPTESEPKPSPNFRRWIWPTAGAFSLLAAVFASGVRNRDRPIIVGTPTRVTNSRVSKLSPPVTDGTVIYFTKTESGEYFVVRKPLAGGDEETLSIPVPNPYVCDISRDKQHLLVRSVVGEFDDLGPFFVVTIPTRVVRQLGSVTGFDGQWSPSEDTLAISHDHDLLLVGNDGSQLRKLSTVAGNIWWPRWSSDGKRVRFTVNDEGTQVRSLWEVSLNNDVPHRLFSDKQPFSNECCGTWLAGDRYFVFQAGSKADSNLWARSEQNWWPLDKPQPFPLVSGFRGPTTSPDGGKFLVRRNIPSIEAVQVDVKDGNYHAVFPEVNGFSALSPDRHWLVFSSMPDDQLILESLDSKQQREIVTAPFRSVEPVWSPDGTKVAFARRTGKEGWRICIFTPGTGRVKEVLPGGTNQIDPSWFPDNRRIAFGGIPTISEPDPLARQVRIVDTEDGSLTSLAAEETAYKPVVSPDGRFLVALASPSQHLLLYDFETRVWKPITEEPVAYPIWSADGKVIYCGIKSEVVALRIKDGSRRLVLDMSRIGTPSTYGRWIDRQPDGSLVLFRDLSMNDFFSFDLSTVR